MPMEAAEGRGHSVMVMDHLRYFMDITSANPTIHYGSREFDRNDFDAVIPRIGASMSFYGTAIVRQFEMMNIYSVNESVAIRRSRDKLRSLQILSRNGIGMPTTAFAHSSKYIDQIIEEVGGAPLVIKLLEGTQGKGVVLAETKKAAESVIQAFMKLKANILVQEYIKESRGADLRCLVVGQKVIAAMERQGPAGEFRSPLNPDYHKVHTIWPVINRDKLSTTKAWCTLMSPSNRYP